MRLKTFLELNVKKILLFSFLIYIALMHIKELPAEGIFRYGVWTLYLPFWLWESLSPLVPEQIYLLMMVPVVLLNLCWIYFLSCLIASIGSFGKLIFSKAKRTLELPTMTKIAAWWLGILAPIFLFILGRIGAIWAIGFGNSSYEARLAIAYSLVNALICFILGVFIMMRKKWAWISFFIFSSVIFIFKVVGLFPLMHDLQNILLIGLSDFPAIKFIFWDVPKFWYILYLIPFILFFLDRKNFFQIAE